MIDICNLFFQIENCEVQENIVEFEDGNEGWVETHHFDSALSTPLTENISDISLEVCKTNVKYKILKIILKSQCRTVIMITIKFFFPYKILKII